MVSNRKRPLYKSSPKAAIRREISRKNPLHDLPEDILQIIVSQLALKDAARMSTLSRMWKMLWNSHSNLSFDSAMVTNSDPKGDQESRRSHEKKFIDTVDTVLQNHSGKNLERFKVAFQLREKHASSLNRWIGFVALSRASEIVLDLDPKSVRIAEDAYEFPFHLFQHDNNIQSIWVKCVSLKPPHNFYGFTKVTKFTISAVRIMEDMGNLLSSCRALRFLDIIRCNFEKLKLHGTFDRLQHLSVAACEMQAIELHATGLLAFTYMGHPLPIVFEESPNLKTANIKLWPGDGHFGYVCSGLSTVLPCLEELRMELRIEAQAPPCAIGEVKFKYLRYVSCTVYVSGMHPNHAGAILRLASILKVAPFLEKLELHMDAGVYPFRSVEINGNVAASPHNHLKTVCMTGFVGFKGQIELALYILENAWSLESMTIDPFGLKQGRWEENPKRLSDARVGREIAHEFLDLEKYRPVVTIL